MAKKRRKPHNRPRPSTPTSGRAVTTAEPVERTATVPVHRTRAEKKELARQQRERQRRREDRARFIRLFGRLVVLSAVLVLVFYLFIRPDGSKEPATLPGELATEAPWPANTDQVAARVEAIGLPPEGTTQHVHANLRIFVHGEPVTVPTGIGVTQDVAAALHTHDDQGTIHVESQTRRDFTLGEFFDVWGVRLSDTCLGGYCEDGEDRLQVFVGGKEVTGSGRDVVLDDETVIVVTFGTPQELPDPIPSTFDFTTVTP